MQQAKYAAAPRRAAEGLRPSPPRIAQAQIASSTQVSQPEGERDENKGAPNPWGGLGGKKTR